jgi:hypothetical protein
MQDHRFWRGFSWKRFGLQTAFFFFAMNIAAVFFSLIEQDVSANFNLKAIIIRFIISVFYGLTVTLWFEPGIDKHFWKRKKKE